MPTLGATGHQVVASIGETEFKVQVTAEDGTTTQVYSVVVQRNSPNLYGWTPTQDLNGLRGAGNEGPSGDLVRRDYDVGGRRCR